MMTDSDTQTSADAMQGAVALRYMSVGVDDNTAASARASECTKWRTMRNWQVGAVKEVTLQNNTTTIKTDLKMLAPRCSSTSVLYARP